MKKKPFKVIKKLSIMAKVKWIFVGFNKPNFNLPKIEPVIPTTISPRVVYTLVYISVFYIFIGGVYDLIQDPVAIGADQNGNPVLIANRNGQQFLIEGIVAGMLMFLGAIGLYLLKEAPSNPHDTGRATMMMTLSIVILFVTFVSLERMMNFKS